MPVESCAPRACEAMARLRGFLCFAAKSNASLLEVIAREVVSPNNNNAGKVDSRPVNTRNDSEAIPISIETE